MMAGQNKTNFLLLQKCPRTNSRDQKPPSWYSTTGGVCRQFSYMYYSLIFSHFVMASPVREPLEPPPPALMAGSSCGGQRPPSACRPPPLLRAGGVGSVCDAVRAGVL